MISLSATWWIRRSKPLPPSVPPSLPPARGGGGGGGGRAGQDEGRATFKGE